MEDSTGSGQELSELEQKIIRQVEYYFGDHNLKHDKFLQKATKEKDGWIALEILIKFNRLKTLTTDFGVICAALMKSPTKLMEVNDDKTEIRRSPDKPVPVDDEELREQQKKRTAYVKGFPDDTSLDDLLEFFKTFGEVETVHMRRWVDKKDKDRKFKGSVFAMFATQEEMDAFMAKDEIKFKDQVLQRETKSDYFKRKYDERKEFKEKRKQKKEEYQTENGSKEKDDSYKTGCILHLTGFTGEDKTRENIKELFDDYASIAWINFSRGATEAHIRFDEADAEHCLRKVSEDNGGKLTLKDNELTGRVLTGQEEADYWKQTREDREKHRQKCLTNKRNRGGGRGRGGYRGGRNSRGGRDNNNKMDESEGKKPAAGGESAASNKHKRFDDNDGGSSNEVDMDAKTVKSEGTGDSSSAPKTSDNGSVSSKHARNDEPGLGEPASKLQKIDSVVADVKKETVPVKEEAV